jgi:hypothetical protein
MKKQLFPGLAVGLLLNLFLSLSALAVDRINITAPPYNAVPNDGVSDNAAINAAVAAGRSIYFPPGIYNYTGSIVLAANQSYRLYGDGPGVSTIVFVGNPYSGIAAFDMGQKTLTVEGLTLQGNTKNCGTGIYALFSDTGTNKKFRSAVIRNVQITGSTRDGFTGGYWSGGIYLYKAQNSVITNVEILGNAHDEAPANPATQFGIIWESTADYLASGMQMSNLQIKFCNSALRTSGLVENLFVTGFEFVLCGNFGAPAVDLNSSDAANLKAAFHLVNGHVHFLQHGIRLTNLRGVKLSKLLLLRHPSEDCGPGGCIGAAGNDVAFNNCVDGVVSQTTFIGASGSIDDEAGIILNNAHFMRLEGNYFTHMLAENPGASCIVILSNSSVVRVVNNLFEITGGLGGVKNRYHDEAPDTYYRGNN